MSLKFYENLPITSDSSYLCIRLYRGLHKKLIMGFQYEGKTFYALKFVFKEVIVIYHVY